jgi:uncharacterized protein YdaU (DUF1376 family)
VTDNKDPSYPWYPRDFAADEPVQLMTLAAEGAYRRLLDHQWLHGSVPGELTQMARICKNITVREMQKIWPSIEGCFTRMEGQPPRLQNRRMERVRTERQEFREKRSAAGKKGAEAAWGEGQSGNGKRFVYALQRPEGGPFKIGVSRSPSRRATRIGEEVGADLLVVAQCEGSFTLERASQVDLACHRIGPEWFEDTPEVREWISDHISPLVEPRQPPPTKPRSSLGSDQTKPSPALALASASALTTKKISPVATGGWPGEFAKAYEPVGLIAPPRLGKALKPVVDRYGVDRTREMWAYYIRHAPHTRFGKLDPEHRDTRGMSP